MCLSNLVFFSPLNSLSPYLHENMHDFSFPAVFPGRKLRPCFNGVDAPGFEGASQTILDVLYAILCDLSVF